MSSVMDPFDFGEYGEPEPSKINDDDFWITWGGPVILAFGISTVLVAVLFAIARPGLMMSGLLVMSEGVLWATVLLLLATVKNLTYGRFLDRRGT